MDSNHGHGREDEKEKGSQLSGARGVKRPSSEDHYNAQHLAKRFNLLNMRDRDRSNLWIQSQGEHRPLDQPTAAQHETDPMQLDETRDRVYIHNLDDELSDEPPDEPRIVFLPDIEKRMSDMPHRLLSADQSHNAAGKEMILYGVPTSLSVTEENDSVRRAILESRARARQNIGNGTSPPNDKTVLGQATNVDHDQHVAAGQDDPDAMDLG